jgi:predicted phage replisome organizer
VAEKKFYWLKLKRDFFKRHDIRIIEEMPNGKEYILFYLKLLLESIDHEGALRFSDTVPYNEQMLSVITNTNIDVVRSAMKMFIELNMIEVFDDKTIYMAEVNKLIGSETSVAERVRKHRENQKLLQCNTSVTKCNTEIDTDKEIDKDTELKQDKEIKSSKRFTKPTIEEVQAYCQERNNGVDAQKWFDYYSANGWKVGKNPMKDWKACVRTWERNVDNGKSKSTVRQCVQQYADEC